MSTRNYDETKCPECGLDILTRNGVFIMHAYCGRMCPGSNKSLDDYKPTNGEAVYFEKTPAGEQGVLIHVQRTQKRLGAIRSNVPHKDQLKGTMFDAEPTDQNQTQLL